ncbi:MAG: hypothetical protein KTR30_34000 [Saprospiraceae bacterium]|nr:hypothetical protein [Saprospiraceae bacterium]
MKLKFYLFFLIGSLLGSACNKSSLDDPEAAPKQQIISELLIEGEAAIRDTLTDCKLLLSMVIRGGSRGSFDTFPGYSENERGHNIRVEGIHTRASIFVHRPTHQDAMFTRTEIENLVLGFEEPVLTGEYVYPMLTVEIGERTYRSFLHDLRPPPYLDFHVSKYDPNASVELSFFDLGALTLCSKPLPAVGQVDVKYKGYLYARDGLDSLHIDADYSVIISDQW